VSICSNIFGEHLAAIFLVSICSNIFGEHLQILFWQPQENF
jgi:hypothetical protein